MTAPSTPPRTCSQADFARLRKVSRKTTTEWKNKGLLVLDEAGQVLVEASIAKLNSRPASYRGGNTKDVTPVTGSNADAAAPKAPDPKAFGFDDPNLPTAEAVRRKENYLSLLRKHEYAVRQGEYVPAAASRAHHAKFLVGVRQAFQRMPTRHCPEIAAKLGVDPGELQIELDRMVTATLLELSEPTVRT